MFHVVSTLTIFLVLGVQPNDIIEGTIKPTSRNLYSKERSARPALWQRSHDITITANPNEIISAIRVIDLRRKKDGLALIIDGDIGQRKIVLNLRSPGSFKKYKFQIDVYADKDNIALNESGNEVLNYLTNITFINTIVDGFLKSAKIKTPTKKQRKRKRKRIAEKIFKYKLQATKRTTTKRPNSTKRKNSNKMKNNTWTKKLTNKKIVKTKMISIPMKPNKFKQKNNETKASALKISSSKRHDKTDTVKKLKQQKNIVNVYLPIEVQHLVISNNLLYNNSSALDYCSHPDCSMKNQHTMCIAAKTHSPRLYVAGMTTWMRYQMLLLHNRLRNNIALGLEPGQPPATNMRKMYWDYELEETAAAWARQCQKRHDECRNTLRFNVLQNMDVRPVLSRVTEAQLLADAVGSWFSGARVLPPESVYSFVKSNCSAPGGCNAHWYTTAAWASTWRIGCSQALCTALRSPCALFRNISEPRRTTLAENILRRTKIMADSEPKRMIDEFAVPDRRQESTLHRGIMLQGNEKRPEARIIAYTFCNYGPAGNVEGFPIYEAGDVCSNCPLGTRCGDRTHQALCVLEGDPELK